jgi:hypothetical protein
MIRIYFKSHRNSTREYWVEASNSGAAHFIKAALVANHWVVVRVENRGG